MSDTHAACMNFVNALEKIPGIIAQYEEHTAKLKADVPQLEAIVAKQWGKEDELKQLKSDLAALDRKSPSPSLQNKMRMAALRISRSNPSSLSRMSMPLMSAQAPLLRDKIPRW